MASLREIYGSAQEAMRSDLNWYNDMDDCWEYDMDYTKADRILDKKYFGDSELEGRHHLREDSSFNFAYSNRYNGKIA